MFFENSLSFQLKRHLAKSSDQNSTAQYIFEPKIVLHHSVTRTLFSIVALRFGLVRISTTSVLKMEKTPRGSVLASLRFLPLCYYIGLAQDYYLSFCKEEENE